MYKKITGVPEGKDQARSEMIRAKSEYRNFKLHLLNKKQEYRDLKADNDIERIQIKKELREAEKFKFGNMTKKSEFLPTLFQEPYFKKGETSVHAIGVPFIAHRDKMKLCMPDRAFTKDQPKWNL